MSFEIPRSFVAAPAFVSGLPRPLASTGMGATVNPLGCSQPSNYFAANLTLGKNTCRQPQSRVVSPSGDMQRLRVPPGKGQRQSENQSPNISVCQPSGLSAKFAQAKLPKSQCIQEGLARQRSASSGFATPRPLERMVSCQVKTLPASRRVCSPRMSAQSSATLSCQSHRPAYVKPALKATEQTAKLSCYSHRPAYLSPDSKSPELVPVGEATELAQANHGGSFFPLDPSLQFCRSENRPDHAKSSDVLADSIALEQSEEPAPTRPSSRPMETSWPRRLPRSVTIDSSDIGRPHRLDESARIRSVTFSECSLATVAVEELTVEETRIDPCRPSLRPHLIESLCVGNSAKIERMSGQHGGLNMGVWLLDDVSQSFVIKMVTSTRFMGMPTEAEVFVDLAHRHPQLMGDTSLAFPIKIIKCTASDKSRRDLIVMRKADGECFANVISRKFDDERSHADLMQDFEAFGAFLANFHARHGLQHGDCQPANVIYDETSGSFSLIDLADLGSSRIKKTDVEHFGKGILSFAKRYSQTLCEAAKQHFEAGYARCR